MTAPTDLVLDGLTIPADLAPRLMAALRSTDPAASEQRPNDADMLAHAVTRWLAFQLETYEGKLPTQDTEQQVEKLRAKAQADGLKAAAKARADAAKIAHKAKA